MSEPDNHNIDDTRLPSGSPQEETGDTASPVSPSPEETGDPTSSEQPSPGKKKKRHLIGPAWLRIPLKVVMWIVIAVLLIPVLLYIPPVQTFVKDIACDVVRKSTGMDVSIDRFRLKWPVDVSLQGVTVIEASGDTMVYAREVVADVKLLPLFGLDVDINRLQLNDGYYRMVSPDSSMILKLRAGLLEVDDKSSANIAKSEILLNKAYIRNGNLALVMDVWKKKNTPQDSTSAPFLIKANQLDLDNFTFTMSMLPTIDTLTFTSGSLHLRKGVVDLSKNLVTASALSADGGDFTYLTPTPEYIKTHPAPPADTLAVSTPPMVIKGDTVALSRFNVLYAMKGAKPLPGFDPSYIQVTDLDIALHDFYNAASTVRLPIAGISASERSGLRITDGHGLVTLDENGLNLDGLDITTLYSHLNATAGVPFALMEMNPSAPLEATASGSIGMPDVEAFMPALKVYTAKVPRRSPLNFDLKASGTLGDVGINTLNVAMPGILSLRANGRAANVLDPKRLRGNLTFDGSLTNPRVIESIIGDMGFALPSLTVKGHATALNQTYTANFALLTAAGDLTADGGVSVTSERYHANVNLHNVNVGHFVPDLGVGAVTAHLDAEGAGFNPTAAGARTDIRLDIASLIYQKQPLRDIKADITLLDGVYGINALSENPGASFHLDGHGTVAPDLYTFDVTAAISNIDLQKFGLSETTNEGRGNITLTGTASPDKWLYDAQANLDNFEWTSGDQFFRIPGHVALDFRSTSDNVAANVDANMTSLNFTSRSGLQHLISTLTATADSVARQIERRDLNVEWLQATLPPFNLDINASGRGLAGQFLNTMGMRMDTIFANLSNDSLISGRIGIREIANASMRADTITLNLLQRGRLLDYKVHMGNRRDNPIAEFADVNLNGYLGSNRVLLSLTQKNQQGETGYRLGLTGAFTDSVATVHFTPLKATIAYLPWQFNSDNHVDVNLINKHIDANLMASSNESSIELQTQQGKAGNDEVHLALKNIHIEDFLRMSVFAPPLTASVNANINLGYTGEWLYGGGNLAISNFTYDKIRVGDFDLGLRAGRNNDGTTGARLDLKIDGDEAMAANVRLVPDSVGALSPEKMGLELTRFPLKIANAFLGNDVASLSGYLTGKMDMNGTFAKPLLNGAIACDSVRVFIPMIGSSLKFNNDSVAVADNVVRFNDFDIWGANSNPLTLNGVVDATSFSSPSFDLNLNADNFQLIGNDQKAHSDIYGKVFFNLDASAKGPMAHFNVNANLNVLPQTDVTYSISSAQAQAQQLDASGVVKFINFNDTTPPAPKDSVAPSMAMRIVAGLTIQPGTQVTVDYPGSTTMGSGKVEIQPSGTLNYFQNYMGDMRLNGQLFLGEGYGKYNVPVMGEKKFNFDPQSYVLFNGNVMNPVLNIKATDVVKANLIENGNSRLVNFDVKLDISNNLEAPKIMFDLSTNDDMTVENELLSMTPEQRSQAAMNLLVTGQYSGQGVKTASSDILTGALYGTLTSYVNGWMANHVKAVDLSFGVNQYDRTVNGETGNAMTYSYTMSKSLFDNRFKISVGGNYSTDSSADENFSENLISDISFEYILRQTTNMTVYARLFRHTGYESILEGEITETGLGFVMKKRLSNLRSLFRWGKRRRAANPDDDVASPSDSVPQAILSGNPEAALPSDSVIKTAKDSTHDK